MPGRTIRSLMSKKILVFESDAGFAQQLKSGFDALAGWTKVDRVDEFLRIATGITIGT